MWLNDGSCIRLRPQHRNHVWSYDFVEAQTHDGRKLRLMTLIDEFTRECLAIRVARRINSFGVIETMADAMLERGVPEHIRSDNGAEMTAKIVRSWLAKLGTKTLYIEPGSPWENGYCELFNGKLRDECLNGEIFYSLKEAIVVLEQWRNQYNTIRPHSSLNYRPPAPQTSTAHHFTWIAVTRCNSLHSAGPKYPSGHEYNYLLTHWHYTDDMQLMTGSGGAWYRWNDYLFTTNLIYGSGQRSGFANQDNTPPYVIVNVGIAKEIKWSVERQAHHIAV